MAITKDVEIERIEIDPRTADVGLKFNLVIAEDGIVIHSAVHRHLIPAGTPLASHLATVNGHLTGHGYPPIAAADSSAIGAVIGAARNNLGKAGLPRQSL